MFELEASIREWRQNLETQKTGARDVLDELESHLREDVDQQMRASVAAQVAFDIAVRRLGLSDQLKSEFGKNALTHVAHWPALICLLLLTGFLVGLHAWVGVADGLRDFSIAYCLLLSIALSFLAGNRPEGNQQLTRQWNRTMLKGQICIGTCGAWVIFSPVYSIVGLIFAIISCGFFAYTLSCKGRRPITTDIGAARS